jgi:glycosyl transferase family 87
MQDSSAHVERSSIRHLSNGGNTLYEKAALSVAILAMALVIGHTLYVFRFRYHEMAFDLYYLWARRFTSGINPWRAPPQCLYPPPFLILLSPLTLLSQQSAYWIWQAIQIAAFFLSVFMMLREIAPLTVIRLAIVLGVLALLLPYILTSTLYESEPSALLLLLLIAAWRLARHERPGWAGLMLALATVLKIYPVFMGGYFLFRRRLGTVLSGTAWTLILVLVTDPRRWTDALFQGAGHYFVSLAWARNGSHISIPNNAYSAISHFSPDPSRQMFWMLVFSLILGLGVLAGAAVVTWQAADVAELDGMALGIWLTVMLMLCPITWNHEITLMLPVYLLPMIYFVTRRPPIPTIGATLFALGIAGIVIPYYSTPMRKLHLYFFAVVSQYIATCIFIRYWSATEQSVGR